ncbi:hypothetical protein [Dethiosulfatarculus sandiegensis]|uniref:Uncharacterized protein n=1 Tax=Dethiosulfatarculus sandiegensis TaxID=1429043 RepID=A0A0D2HWU3_9BACT|nr:hypothetical protein [Dethiosulfatarculus sandiegensis]KIX14848.1 hypothetical protein X474_06800 [Dethiosulfatarculus sandiegensis]
MLPFAFEWHWDIGHIIFFGLFYSALGVITCGLVYAFVSNLKELYKGGGHGHDDHDKAEEKPDQNGDTQPAEA